MLCHAVFRQVPQSSVKGIKMGDSSAQLFLASDAHLFAARKRGIGSLYVKKGTRSGGNTFDFLLNIGRFYPVWMHDFGKAQ